MHEQLAKYFALSASERFLFERGVFDPHTTMLPPDAARNTMIVELGLLEWEEDERDVRYADLTTYELENRVANFAQRSAALDMRVSGTARPKNLAHVFAIDLQPTMMFQAFCYYMAAFDAYDGVAFDTVRSASLRTTTCTRACACAFLFRLIFPFRSHRSGAYILNPPPPFFLCSFPFLHLHLHTSIRLEPGAQCCYRTRCRRVRSAVKVTARRYTCVHGTRDEVDPPHTRCALRNRNVRA